MQSQPAQAVGLQPCALRQRQVPVASGPGQQGFPMALPVVARMLPVLGPVPPLEAHMRALERR